MFKGKHILIGVTGSIAIYKTLDLISCLKKQGAEVKVIMTQSATEFVTPLTFQTMSQNLVTVDMFKEPVAWDVQHISLAKWADILLIAPATANMIGKIAGGIADDMLSTVAMATKAKILIAPAMNTAMYENIATVENMSLLKKRGISFVEPDAGRLACGDIGKGKLASVEEIQEALAYHLTDHDLEDVRIMVTAGATCEALDPVRFITNHSSGRMGIEIARAAKYRGAEVTLVAGHVDFPVPTGIRVISVSSAREMHKACMELFPSQGIVIKAAAVGDYRPETCSDSKIKKNENMTLSLVKNPDILAEMGQIKEENQLLIGFCMETEDLVKNAEKKLKNKNLDMIVANHLFDHNAGFKSTHNTVTILLKNGIQENLPNMTKFEVANEILNRAFHMKQEKVKA